MTEHDHEHDHEHEHEHHQHSHDWRAELEQEREFARHYYLHEFDWRGHPRPEGFDGPRYYPPASDWRVVARLDRTAPGTGEHVKIATSTGQLRDQAVAGQLVFDVDGEEQRLTAFLSQQDDELVVLFVPFRDETSGNETYGAGRYVEVPMRPNDDEALLDFNYAYNPSCVFSPAYDCPYPPPTNRMTFPVRAGEMLPYDQPHD